MIKGRRPPRLRQIFQSYNAPLFFVTICTLHRRNIPSLEAAHNALLLYGTRATKEFIVALGRYVIMPDHLHLFVRGDQSFVLGTWVKGLKRAILNGFPPNRRRLFGNRDSLIIFCAAMKVMHRNGSMFGRILCARDWLNLQKIGLIKVRSFGSTALSGVEARVLTRKGKSRSAAEDSRLYNVG
jgi:REP element-mobilizing transposase RayT